MFSRRIEHILASKPDSPIYIDLPAVSHTALSRTRQRPAKSRSLMDYLSRSGAQTKPDDVDEVLKVLDKRDVRSAAAEVERLRLIKSEAEVQVMRKAADASSAAHAKVRPLPLSLLPLLPLSTATLGSRLPFLDLELIGLCLSPTGHALCPSRPHRAPLDVALYLPRLAPRRRTRGLRPRLRVGQAGPYDPLPRQQPADQAGRDGPPRRRVRVGRVRERHYPCVPRPPPSYLHGS